MQGRIALQKHFVRNAARCLFLFREAFRVRALPRACVGRFTCAFTR
jgi:hypothetical protein